jgi:hypothetical protein
MPTLIKTTQDGRKLEVAGLAVTLDGKLECFELIEVAAHPRRRAILDVAPEATHLAGRVTLTADEAARVRAAFAEAEAAVLKDPRAIAERFRLAVQRKACAEGIE